jgi:hypothetical protein
MHGGTRNREIFGTLNLVDILNLIQDTDLKARHCERSEAIQMLGIHGLPRFARNDELKK